jgi:hypothetical protein
MRIIEKKMNEAIRNRTDWSLSNTEVDYNEGSNRVCIYLHGNHIANVWYEQDTVTLLYLTDAGWETRTTKSRLNAILDEFAPGYRIFQHNHRWRIAYPEAKRENISPFWVGHTNIQVNSELKEVANG